MKLKIQGLIIMLLISSFLSYAQEVKYLDYNGEKTSKKRAAYLETTAEVDENHKIILIRNTFNGGVISEGVYLKEGNKIKDGYYKEYYHNGELYISSEYINGKKVGIETEYDKHGKITRKLTYNEEGIGEELVYYPSGAIKEKNLYKNENLEGLSQAFYESGTLESEKVYVANKVQGEAKTYFETGNLKSVFHYVNDEKQGEFKEYYKTGELESSGNMEADKKQGDFYSYYKSGVKRRYEYYSDDEADKKQGRCFDTDGAKVKYFPRSIRPLINKKGANLKDFQLEAMMSISRNFKYPTLAREMGLQDKIYVSFVFSKEGEIKDVQIINSGPYHEILGQEAIRLIKLIGEEKITNGFFEGEPVDFPFTIPIRFKIK